MCKVPWDSLHVNHLISQLEPYNSYWMAAIVWGKASVLELMRLHSVSRPEFLPGRAEGRLDWWKHSSSAVGRITPLLSEGEVTAKAAKNRLYGAVGTQC